MRRGASDKELATLFTLFNQGQYPELEQAARKLVKKFPGCGICWKVSGTAMLIQGRMDEARAHLQKAVLHLPDDPEVQSNLGSTYQALGRLAEAEVCCRRAVKIDPACAEYHNNLGVTLMALKRASDAEASYRRALDIQSNFPAAYQNLAIALVDQSRFVEAETVCREALATKPMGETAAALYVNLGVTLKEQGLLAQAAESYRNAIELSPTYAEAYSNLGMIFQVTGPAGEAEASFRQALKLKPDHVGAHSNLIFALDLIESADVASVQAERKAWNDRHAAPLYRPPVFENSLDEARRLRIGYVSADFREHSAARIFETLLLHFDRQRFEVFAYANNANEDAVTQCFKKSVTHWRRIAGQSDEAVTELIRQDQIDILVDLSGHSAGNRLLVFARKPAPIQITAWGHAIGTGVKTIDYFFTDIVQVPLEERSLYAETIHYLPSAVCFSSDENRPAVGPLPALQKKFITFGSLNRLCKLSAPTLVLWTRILVAVPDSHLLLKTAEFDDAATRARIIEYFVQAGIAAERIELQGKTSWFEHMAAFNQVDIALDPFPHGGGVTTLEGLLMGVPTLTLRWPTVVGRLGASILTTLGLTDWIAETEDECLQLAMDKSKNIQTLAALRGALRERFLTSVLGDGKAYLKIVEGEYRQLWRTWVQEHKKNGHGSEHLAPSDPLPQAERDQLIALFNAGQSLDVESLACSLLKEFSDSGFVWMLLGVALQAQGKEALPALQKAVALAPDNANAHSNLGTTLRAIGQLDDAVASYRRALEIKPDLAVLHNNLGTALKDLSRFDDAAASFRRAVELQPDLAVAHSNLGVALKELGQLDAAVTCYRQALKIKPDYVEAYCNLGAALNDLGQHDDAVASFLRALGINPSSINAHNNLGIALRDIGRPDEAVASFHRALEINSDYAEAHNNLGFALLDTGRLDSAMASFRRALEIKPDYAEAHNNLGNALRLLGQLEDAVASYQRAIEINSDYALAHSNLGVALLNSGQIGSALTRFDRALEIKPDLTVAHNNRGNALLTLGQLDNAIASYRRALKIKLDYAETHSNLIFALDLIESADVPSVQAERKAWSDRHAAPLYRLPIFDNSLDEARHLRIGYVSADFRTHSASRIFETMLLHFDRQQFEVFAYSNNVHEDAVTQRFQQSVTTWRCIVGQSDEAVTELIRQDQIDILVDLSGHSAGNRLLVFARKPAPIQITAWGHAVGTGVKAIDYFFTDIVQVPPDEQALYAETIRYLPSAVCFSSDETRPPVGPLPALQKKCITFGSLNRLCKLSERTLALWAKILQATPDSRLLLKTAEFDDEAARVRITAYFVQSGIAAERIKLRGKTPWFEHMAAFNEIDIALDPFPHGGGITTLEGLLMGVPTVTLRWPTVAGRLGASILTTLGMTDWIAETEDDYLQRAIAKAHDIRALAALRAELRIRFQSSILGDGKAYLKIVEGEYRQLWRTWVQGHKKNGHGSAQLAPSDPLPQAERDRLIALFNAGQQLDVESLARSLLKEFSDSGFVWMLLGVALQAQGKEALPALQKAVALAPDNANAHSNLGTTLRAIGQLDEAVASYRRALEIKPDLAVLHNNLGTALKDLSRFDDAAASFRRAVELQPDLAVAHSNLGVALKELGQLDAAVTCYRQALKIKPDYVEAHSNLIFALDLAESADAASLQAERKAWGERHAAPLYHQATFSNTLDGERRLRIGYVSADFREHSAARTFEAMLLHFDPQRFEVFAYSNNAREDALTRRIQQSVTYWRRIVGQSDEAIAELVRQDGIDILVDLSGHSAGNRLLVFARKPAPIQITAWGHATGTGVKAIDFFFTDAVMVPPKERAYYAETIRYLPSAASFASDEAPPPIKPLPALINTFITFGSFNRLCKISERSFTLWIKILLATPDSRLLLKTAERDDEATHARITERFVRAGIAAERIELQGRTAWFDHLAAFNQIDIALDPFPHGGGVTTLEGLLMGIPTITLCWPTITGRLGASFLTTLGLTDWIAETEEAYLRLALAKAKDIQALSVLRKQLRGRFQASVLGDEKAYLKVVEAEYRQLWRDWVTKQGGQ